MFKEITDKVPAILTPVQVKRDKEYLRKRHGSKGYLIFKFARQPQDRYMVARVPQSDLGRKDVNHYAVFLDAALAEKQAEFWNG